jgi:pimeloyl-ACP methyl ester carboxylesterase
VSEISHRAIEANGISIHIAEAGRGPLVLFCHGWPESWYSWRHQLKTLSAAGYHAVALDMRGYGRTSSPAEVDKFSLLHLVGDVVGVADALGADDPVVVGHDFGATVAWHTALLRPDRFRAVAGLSVAFRPRGPLLPSQVMPHTADAQWYQLYFQDVGVAEAEFDQDPVDSARRIFYAMSGDAPQPDGVANLMVPRPGRFLDQMPDPDHLPAWFTPADVEFYAREYARASFRGGVNWYRNMDRNWELLAPFTGAKVEPPALYVTGERDAFIRFPGMSDYIKNTMTEYVPNLRKTVILPGCGHWTQQERPAEVNQELLEFLAGLE